MKSNQKLLLFSAEWCQVCKPVKKLLQDSNLLNVVIVDIDSSVELAEKHNIRSIPTIIVTENDVEIRRHLGSCSTRQLQELLLKV